MNSQYSYYWFSARSSRTAPESHTHAGGLDSAAQQLDCSAAGCGTPAEEPRHVNRTARAQRQPHTK